MTKLSTDLSTISLTTYKNGQCILRYETYSGNDQTCNYCKKKGLFIQVCSKKMRSRQRIHGIQDTAPSLELRIRNSDEAPATVNIDRTGRKNERDNSKNKTRHGSTGERVTPLNISIHVLSEYGRQRQTKTRNTKPNKGHSSCICMMAQESSISMQLKRQQDNSNNL